MKAGISIVNVRALTPCRNGEGRTTWSDEETLINVFDIESVKPHRGHYPFYGGQPMVTIRTRSGDEIIALGSVAGFNEALQKAAGLL
jgi:hypothetical protein